MPPGGTATPVLRAQKDRVVTLTLNRPEARNAIDLPLLQALRAELAEAQAAKAGCVVLTGAGPSFSAGGDVRQMLAMREQPAAGMQRLRRELLAVVEAMQALDAPVIAKVNGDCVGAGLGLALASDLVYASGTARFGAPFATLGLVPDTALTHALPRRVGLHRAMDLVLTGRLLGSGDAQAWGLVNQVVARERLDAVVFEAAGKLAALPTAALGEAKRALRRGAELGWEQAMVLEAYTQGTRFASPEHAAGVEAFLKHRRGAAGASGSGGAGATSSAGAGGGAGGSGASP